ncbi:MAG: sigma 54-interacting transcriptional regulator [Planctomycetaceae bacterium]
MPNPSTTGEPAEPAMFAKAFIVVRRGGRWTDLLRLSPNKTAVIGRASTNQIVIRSHQASRQHAEIRWDAGQWWVRDLGSRNGTLVDGERIDVARPLREGSRIEVAGCAMTFVSRVADALTGGPRSAQRPTQDRGQQPLTDEQLTIEGIESDSIVQRSTHSRYLDLAFERASDNDDRSRNGWQTLFGLAYRLASAASIEEAAQTTLAMIGGAIPGSGGGVFLPRPHRPANALKSRSDTEQASLVAFFTHDDRSYRPPASSIVESVIATGIAVMARNIVDDSELQQADSRGDYSSSASIVAPIALKRPKDHETPHVGYLHVYLTRVDEDDTSTCLELAIAAAGVLAVAIDNLRTRGQLANSLRQSRKQVENLRGRLEDSVQIVGESDEIKRVKSIIRRVAPADTTVLIRGESGVGKELVAAAIHQHSPRRDAPLVCLNCAALSPTLLESELFGHEKGAFTGATEQKKGKFESAAGGTLMLDEIGEMPIDLQAKLLRVLEGHPFERLGGQHPIKVDVRLIAATNRDLPQEVKRGRFRADLYYRLNVVEIVVPPLRDRRGDILPIANHYVTYFSNKTARRVDGFTRGAAELMLSHSWPGNIRELKNTIERAIVLGCNDTVGVDDLNLQVEDMSTDTAAEPTPRATPPPAPAAPTTISTLDEMEQQHLVAALRAVGGNKSRAAIMLGIERSTLDRKLKRFGIEPSAYREP